VLEQAILHAGDGTERAVGDSWHRERGKRPRVVVKLGSAVLTHPRRGLREEVIGETAEQLANLGAGRVRDVIVVSSGAIAAGRKALGLTGTLSLSRKQAAAAAGQPLLMEAWTRSLSRRGLQAAQVLLTHEDIASRSRYLAARDTFEALLEAGAVPVVNENDTVATAEIRMGDNDHLAALVALMLHADHLFLLTDTDGLFTADPHRDPTARRIPILGPADLVEDQQAGQSHRGSPGSGGMASKIRAARLAARFGIPVTVARGDRERCLEDLLAGKDLGTRVLPLSDRPPPSRQVWIATARRPVGEIRLDAGAVLALTVRGKSLLPAGVEEVRGEFRAGDLVRLRGPGGEDLGVGITGWDAVSLIEGKGTHRDRRRELVKAGLPPEVVHRDDWSPPYPGDSEEGT